MNRWGRLRTCVLITTWLSVDCDFCPGMAHPGREVSLRLINFATPAFIRGECVGVRCQRSHSLHSHIPAEGIMMSKNELHYCFMTFAPELWDTRGSGGMLIVRVVFTRRPLTPVQPIAHQLKKKVTLTIKTSTLKRDVAMYIRKNVHISTFSPGWRRDAFWDQEPKFWVRRRHSEIME